MIEDDLRTYLLAESAVTAIVGSRIMPAPVPPTDRWPCITYDRGASEHQRHQGGGAALCNASVTLTLCAERQRDVESLADTIRTNLDGFRGTMGSATVRLATVSEERDIPVGPEPNAEKATKVRALDLTIWFVEGVPVLS